MAKYFRNRGYEHDGYVATSDTGTLDDYRGDITHHPMARVAVKRASELSLYGNGRYMGRDSRDPETRIRDAMWGENPDDIDRAVERQHTTPQMFFPEPAEITSAFADPSMKVHMGTLLGQIINDHGKNLRATYDLSPHSSKLARKGIEAGVIQGHPENPEAEDYNDIDFSPKNLRFQDGKPEDTDFESVPKHLVDAGRRTIHNLLRPKPLSPQFQALQQLENDRGSTYNPADDPNSMKLPGMD